MWKVPVGAKRVVPQLEVGFLDGYNISLAGCDLLPQRTSLGRVIQTIGIYREEFDGHTCGK